MPDVPQADAWLADRLGILRSEVAETDELDLLLNLVGGWYQHVAKLQADLPCSDDDRTVWGAYDVVAAVALRSRIERGMSRAGTGIHPLVRAAVDEVDETFREFTEVDPQERLARLDGSSPDASAWWWGRVPSDGPARRELDRIST